MALLLFVIESLEHRQLLSTYFVSPSGNDSYSGLESSAAWQTVAKVNASSFSPGDTILFERGGQWHESLAASSSGTNAEPITYGAYGDPNLARPLFIGSDDADVAAFQPAAGSTAYTLDTTLPINWVFDNHEFLHMSEKVTSTGDLATNIDYVTNNAGTWYFTGTKLYINLGGSLTSHIISFAVRDDAVLAFGQNNLVFDSLAVTETAKDGAGYGFRSQDCTNITFENCTATLCGKHHFGVIDTTGFVGKDLFASGAPPDLGFGGASAYVSFSDSINGRHGDTSQWIDCSWQNPNGAYPIFITHGDPGAVGSVLLQNLTTSGWGAGAVCYSTDPNEVITIKGGHFNDCWIDLDTNDSLVDGVLFTGDHGAANINGNNTTVQRCTFEGVAPDPYRGFNGALTVSGQNDTVQSNVFRQFVASFGPAVNVVAGDTNTHIFNNVFDTTYPIWRMTGDTPLFDSDRNIFRSDFQTEIGDVGHILLQNWQQWRSAGYDLYSNILPVGAVSYSGDIEHVADAATLGWAVGDNSVVVSHVFGGDTNVDGIVDVGDLGSLATNFGRTANSTWVEGDFNHDGSVDVADLGELASNYGSNFSGANSPASTIISNAKFELRPSAPLTVSVWNDFSREDVDPWQRYQNSD